MLELRNVCFDINGKRILNNINLKLNKGEMVAFTGANGSGKSTLMKIIMGIERVSEGKILFNGKDISNLGITERAKLGISFAFQQPVKFKGLTIAKLFEISAGRKLEKKEQCKVLTTLGLCPSEYLNRELDSSLSGGELKRLEIASVLFKQSECLIFDEPEAGIDLWSFNKLIQVFQAIKIEKNPLLILVSHQERLLRTADRVVLMSAGEIIKVDIPQNVLQEV